MNTTFDQVADYFATCKAYWLRQGDSEQVASVAIRPSSVVASFSVTNGLPVTIHLKKL